MSRMSILKVGGWMAASNHIDTVVEKHMHWIRGHGPYYVRWTPDSRKGPQGFIVSPTLAAANALRSSEFYSILQSTEACLYTDVYES